MKRLLLVSGNLSLRMALGQDYEIVEERPSRNWRLDPSGISGVDAVLLDLHDEAMTSAALAEIFANDFSGVVLVCAVAGEDWSHVADQAPDRIGVIELPVNGAALSEALARLMPSKRAGRLGQRRHDDQSHTAGATVPPAQPLEVDSQAESVDPESAVPVQRSDSLHDHVRQLAAGIPRLRAVSSVAEDLIEAAVGSTSSEAGAVLVPDGAYWRVAAGVGVRHVEWRLAVAADTWLIDEAVTQRHGIVVEDTDIARQRLSGTPLASWEQLAVVPVGGTDVVVLVARHEGPYAEDDVRRLSELTDEFRPGLDDAIALRDLARSLQDFADAELQDAES